MRDGRQQSLNSIWDSKGASTALHREQQATMRITNSMQGILTDAARSNGGRCLRWQCLYYATDMTHAYQSYVKSLPSTDFARRYKHGTCKQPCRSISTATTELRACLGLLLLLCGRRLLTLLACVSRSQHAWPDHHYRL